MIMPDTDDIYNKIINIIIIITKMVLINIRNTQIADKYIMET